MFVHNKGIGSKKKINKHKGLDEFKMKEKLNISEILLSCMSFPLTQVD